MEPKEATRTTRRVNKKGKLVLLQRYAAILTTEAEQGETGELWADTRTVNAIVLAIEANTSRTCNCISLVRTRQKDFEAN